MELSNLTIAGLSAALLAAYHIALFIRIKRSPEKTAFGQHRIARGLWIKHFARSKNEILVVQTLRNWLMSATFLATTSIFVALGLLGIISTADKITGLSQELTALGETDTNLILFKFTLILFLFMVAFFSFTLSIRFINHASFVTNIPVEETEDLPFLNKHNDMKRASVFYFLGLRCLYISVPLVMWILGPIWLLISSVLLIAVLFPLD